MSNTTELPLSLSKANLELQVKLVKLLQENSQKWLDFGYRLINDGIAESDNTVQNLLKAENWQKLATLPADAFWTQIQQRFGDSQAVFQIVIDAQTTLANGLQDAVQTWQKETLEAYGSAAQATTFTDVPWGNLFKQSAWNDVFKPWQQLLSGFNVPAATSKPAPAKKEASK